MTIPDPWLLAFLAAVLLLLRGAGSGLVKPEPWMSGPLFCAVAGILPGPVAWWRARVFVLSILLFRWLPAWVLRGGPMSWTRPFWHRLFAGWFGPAGGAALLHACGGRDASGVGTLWPGVVRGVTGRHLSILPGWNRQCWAVGRALGGAVA